MANEESGLLQILKTNCQIIDKEVRLTLDHTGSYVCGVLCAYKLSKDTCGKKEGGNDNYKRCGFYGTKIK